MYVNGCFTHVCVYGSGGILLWLWFGVCFRDDGLVVGVNLGVANVHGLRCELLGLLVVCVFFLDVCRFLCVR